MVGARCSCLQGMWSDLCWVSTLCFNGVQLLEVLHGQELHASCYFAVL